MFRESLNIHEVIISYDDKNNIMLIKWKENCGNILDEEYKPVLEKIRNHIKEKEPQKLIADMSSCSYHLTPASGRWFKTPLYSFYTELPPRRIALILPENMFVTAFFDAARANQSIDSDQKLQYFSDQEKAFYWINKN